MQPVKGLLGSSWQTHTIVPAETNAARWVSASDPINWPMRIYRVVTPRPVVPVGLDGGKALDTGR